MGSGGGTTNTKQSHPTVPSWLAPLLKSDVTQFQQAEKNLPSLSALYGQVPLQGTAPFTPEQNALIAQISGRSGQLNPAEQAAQGQYEQFLGQKGPSAATLAELQQFNDLQAPAILQQANLMGQGTSGAALSALAQGQESALVPFLQQDEQNKLTAASDLQGLGTQEFNQQTTDLANALQAAGMPQQLAQQQADALFQQLQQKFQFAQGVQTAPFGLLGSTIGGGTSGSVTTQPKL